MAVNTRRLFLLSDLHRELWKSPLKFSQMYRKANVGKGDALVLAGDICSAGYERLFYRTLHDAKALFERVFFVPGNHEYYNLNHGHQRTFDMTEANARMKSLCRNTGVEYLPEQVISLHNNQGEHFALVGDTLWAEPLPHTWKCSNDFRYISHTGDLDALQPQHMVDLHRKQKTALAERIQILREAGVENVICVTHHLPSFKLIHPTYEDSTINSLFASNSDELLEHPVKACLFGHTHRTLAVRIGTVQCVSNPYGYRGEHGRTGWNPFLHYDLDEKQFKRSAYNSLGFVEK